MNPGIREILFEKKPLSPSFTDAFRKGSYILLVSQSIFNNEMPEKARKKVNSDMEMILLTLAEARVLGCLIEKEATTPDYYPLTLNALQTACNQKSSRNPVVDYDAKEVVRAVDGLRSKKLALLIGQGGARVPKYQHIARETLALPPDQLALLACLLLRGAQTAGELKVRTERLFQFESPEQVEAALESMCAQAEAPYVVKLPRQPGQRECRYAHLLCGEPEIIEEESTTVAPEMARVQLEQKENRIAQLESQLDELRGQLEELRQEFIEFRKLLE